MHLYLKTHTRYAKKEVIIHLLKKGFNFRLLEHEYYMVVKWDIPFDPRSREDGEQSRGRELISS